MMAALDLSTLQIEALKEVGNIGAGHAATALSEMLGEPITIGIPSVEILAFSGLTSRLGRSSRTVSAVHLDVRGVAPCQIVVLFDAEQARGFTNIFTAAPVEPASFDALCASTVKEVGNIIAGAYLTALTSLTGITLRASVPTLSTGPAATALFALVNVRPDQHALYVETSFAKDRPLLGGEFILLPEPGSIAPLLSVFGL